MHVLQSDACLDRPSFPSTAHLRYPAANRPWLQLISLASSCTLPAATVRSQEFGPCLLGLKASECGPWCCFPRECFAPEQLRGFSRRSFDLAANKAANGLCSLPVDRVPNMLAI